MSCRVQQQTENYRKYLYNSSLGVLKLRISHGLSILVMKLRLQFETLTTKIAREGRCFEQKIFSSQNGAKFCCFCKMLAVSELWILSENINAEDLQKVYLLGWERPPFTWKKVTFRRVKDHLFHYKRPQNAGRTVTYRTPKCTKRKQKRHKMLMKYAKNRFFSVHKFVNRI